MTIIKVVVVDDFSVDRLIIYVTDAPFLFSHIGSNIRLLGFGLSGANRSTKEICQNVRKSINQSNDQLFLVDHFSLGSSFIYVCVQMDPKPASRLI